VVLKTEGVNFTLNSQNYNVYTLMAGHHRSHELVTCTIWYG